MAGNLDNLKPTKAEEVTVVTETIDNPTVTAINVQEIIEQQENKIIYGGSY